MDKTVRSPLGTTFGGGLIYPLGGGLPYPAVLQSQGRSYATKTMLVKRHHLIEYGQVNIIARQVQLEECGASCVLSWLYTQALDELGLSRLTAIWSVQEVVAGQGVVRVPDDISEVHKLLQRQDFLRVQLVCEGRQELVHNGLKVLLPTGDSEVDKLGGHHFWIAEEWLN